MLKRLILLGTLLLSGGSPALALDWQIAAAHVVLAESTYTPAYVAFWIDTAAGTCPANNYLFYYPRGATSDERTANSSAILSTLLTAKATGITIGLGGNNSGCTATYLFLR